jgi:uncharacterized protein
MKFTREMSEGFYTIHAYAPGGVVLNSPDPEDDRDEEGRIELQQSFIVTPEQLVPEWGTKSLEQLQKEDLTPIREMEPEIFLLGTGSKLQFPDNELLAAMIELGMGYEVMNSPAACRTYNILAGEGRQVAAAIIIE